MKKRLSPILIGCALMAASCGNKQHTDQSVAAPATEGQQSVPANHKYGVKSGILIFTIENSMMKMNMQRKVYFDDFGAKETAEVYSDNKLADKVMDKGDGFLYQIGVQYGSGTKTKNISANGTELKFDMSESAWPERYRKEFNFAKQPNQTICGKDCEVYTTNSKGMKAKYAGWNGILFLIETESPMGNGILKTSTTLIEFQENASIPESVWEIPAGVTITEK